MKKIAMIFVAVLIGGYIILCLFFYLFQEKFIFNSRKLAHDYEFASDSEYEELYFTMDDGVRLHGLLCKSDSSKGLIFFLHGSGGSIKWYESKIPDYLKLGYDIFLIDYRGYGKSEGKYKREDQIIDDIKQVYEEIKASYVESKIIIVGLSMGTHLAAMLAANYNPQALVLQGSPVSMLSSGKRVLPFIPVSLLARYKLDTRPYLPNINNTILIFHGELDDRTTVENALRLKPLLKPTDKFIILEGEGHNDFANNDQYIKELKEIIDN